MNTRFVILLGILVALIGCDPRKPSTQDQAEQAETEDVERWPGEDLGPGPENRYAVTWDITGEWEIYAIDPPGPPHTEPYDKFAVQSGITGYVLVPGAGMSDWTPCSGETEIKLTLIGGSTYSFCAHVDPHDASHAKDHSNFNVVFVGPNPALTPPTRRCHIVAIGGGPGDVIHGGTAHGRG